MIHGVEWLMGQRRLNAACMGLTKIGLRGLGVNIDHHLDRSGERIFLNGLLAQFPELICFDIGANVGDYTAALADAGAREIVAFEPVRQTFVELELNVGSLPRVKLVHTAVGERDGVVQFDVPAVASQSILASRDLSIAPEAKAAHQTVSVPICTLDKFVETNGIEPGFVKIDVEGFELEVIQGMKGLLARKPPAAIQFEFNQHHLKRKQSLLDFQEVLPGFSFFRIATHSLRPLTPEHYLSNIFTYCNIVALERSAAERLSFMW
jgi:FkbM family methyltransferase